MKTTATLFWGLFLSLTCYSQEQKLEGRFIKFNLQGSNDFDIRSYMNNDALSFNSSETHSLSSELGYGWFYKNKKSIYFGAGTSFTYQYSRTNKRWSNGFYGTIERASYKNIYENKILFSLSQELILAYSYSRAYGDDTDYENPYVQNHTLAFRLKPGLIYRYSKASNFILQFDLIALQLSQQKTGGYIFENETTQFRYSLFSDYNLAAIQIGYLWTPSFIQSKKVNDL